MGYLGNENTVTGTQNSKRLVVQATPNQTISTVTGGYTIGQLDVFRNGVKLAPADDYSANNGTTVTFINALNSGDDIQYVVYENFDVANAMGVSGQQTLVGDLSVSGIITATGGFNVGIQSGGEVINAGAAITTLNFVGAGNTFKKTGNAIDISIAGGGGGAGAFTTAITGIQTTSQTVGIGTTSVDDAELQGIGNSARGLYVSNGMILYDNAINGNHYIGTSMNGLMAGPVSVNGVLNVDGNFVVV